MIDLDKLSALEKAATPGPWYAWRRDGLRKHNIDDTETVKEMIKQIRIRWIL